LSSRHDGADFDIGEFKETASPSGLRREGRDLVSGGGTTDALIAEIDAIKFDDPPETSEVVETPVLESSNSGFTVSPTMTRWSHSRPCSRTCSPVSRRAGDRR
jgi:hypothetical protein